MATSIKATNQMIKRKNIMRRLIKLIAMGIQYKMWGKVKKSSGTFKMDSDTLAFDNEYRVLRNFKLYLNALEIILLIV